MKIPFLYIFSGLPGTGKSTLAKGIASHLETAYFRIDTVEQGLRDLCKIELIAQGYYLTARVVADNLALGIDVITDSCNPVLESRVLWENTAKTVGAEFINIEVICSDKSEHRSRVETRQTPVPGLVLPTWQQVLDREYEAWAKDRIILDTANQDEKESIHELLKCICQWKNNIQQTRAGDADSPRA